MFALGCQTLEAVEVAMSEHGSLSPLGKEGVGGMEQGAPPRLQICIYTRGMQHRDDVKEMLGFHLLDVYTM